MGSVEFLTCWIMIIILIIDNLFHHRRTILHCSIVVVQPVQMVSCILWGIAQKLIEPFDRIIWLHCQIEYIREAERTIRTQVNLTDAQSQSQSVSSTLNHSVSFSFHYGFQNRRQGFHSWRHQGLVSAFGMIIDWRDGSWFSIDLSSWMVGSFCCWFYNTFLWFLDSDMSLPERVEQNMFSSAASI